MGHTFVKLIDHYLVWSSVVDAPIFICKSLAELKEWATNEYGQSYMRYHDSDFDPLLSRLETVGTSSLRDKSAVDTIWLNRVGYQESTLTIEGIYRYCCLGERIQPEWVVPYQDALNDDYPLYDHVTDGWEEYCKSREENKND